MVTGPGCWPWFLIIYVSILADIFVLALDLEFLPLKHKSICDKSFAVIGLRLWKHPRALSLEPFK